MTLYYRLLFTHCQGLQPSSVLELRDILAMFHGVSDKVVEEQLLKALKLLLQ